MFELAFIVGIYSYIIFFAGIAGILYKNVIISFTLIYLVLVAFYVIKFHKIKFSEFLTKKISLFSKLILFLLLLQIIINLVGVLGPEISFDALWYHLTLPKIYLTYHTIFHIPGNLLYYSDMPKLAEMLYVTALSVGNEILAKFVHFIFGILTLFVIYKISRKFLSKELSLLACLVFYSNLVVGWESIAAYVDLSRTFFESLALLGFLNWTENFDRKWLIIASLILGFAVTTKLIALGSLLIFLFLILSVLRKKSAGQVIKDISTFVAGVVVVPLPWFLFSFVNTGNPFYPFLSKSINLGINYSLPNPFNIIQDLANLFIYSADPISPIYLIMVPFFILLYVKSKDKVKLLFIYSFLALFLWYLTPKIGGGRFILPYLPVFSVLVVYAIGLLKDRLIIKSLILIILLIALSSIGYRALANKKYIPVLLGRETKAEFLSKNLNFNFGDFYDTDGFFNKSLNSSDVVLLYGFHNLYYIDFSFIDSSWVKKGDRFNFIATQNIQLPKRFSDWRQIYYNKVTNVKLYSLEGKEWVY